MLREDLRRWFKEKWVDISRKTKSGKHPPCGRGKATDSKYPKCRPSVRVSSETPKTSGEMTQKEKKKAVTKKRRAESKVSTTRAGRKPVMTSLNESKKCKCEGKCTCGMKERTKKAIKFVKGLKEQTELKNKYTCETDKLFVEDVNQSCLNKKTLVQFINEENQIVYAKGYLRIASNEGLKAGNDFEIVNENKVTGFKNENILSMKYFDGMLKEYTVLNEGKNKPTNSSLWSKAKSLAKSKFKVYPSAYANGWASKWYKKHGGGWKSVNEEVILSEEIVNAKHAGTMTKKEIKSRDKLAKKVKAKPIKGKDTEENAKYRLATFIELKKRGEEPKGKAKKKKKGKKKVLNEKKMDNTPMLPWEQAEKQQSLRTSQENWDKKHEELIDSRPSIAIATREMLRNHGPRPS
jgi:hypothetical protein